MNSKDYSTTEIEQSTEQNNKINKPKNYIPIITDDKSIIEYFKLAKQYRYSKKQHTLKIKTFNKRYKKDVLQLKNKYKMYYNIVNNDFNKTLTSLENSLKTINTSNIFYKQLTNYMDMLYKKYDINIIFRAFYFSFLLDIYIMVQDDKHIINLNKLSEDEQKQFINRTIDHLLQFYNGFVPKKEYKFYSLEFTTKHFNEDPNFEDESWNTNKNDPNFLIFYNVCYNLHYIRQEYVLDFVKVDEIFDKAYQKMQPYLKKKYLKNNFWVSELRTITNEYVEEIQIIYNKYFHYSYPFNRIDLIYIFGDVLYQPPKDNYYGINNEYSLTDYFEAFLEEIPYSDFYFRNAPYFDNEEDPSDIEVEEEDEEDDDEEDDDDED